MPVSLGKTSVRGMLRASAMLTIVAVSIALGTPRVVRAESNGCGLHTLKGSYVFAASGFNITMAGAALPKAIVEVVEFNGDGTLSVPAATVSINGSVSRSENGVGAYTLESDCRGTLSFAPFLTFDIFFDATGKLGHMIQTNAGTVMQGTIRPVVLPGGGAN